MKCFNCGYEEQTNSPNCPHCNAKYSLASALNWIIRDRGEAVLSQPRTIKSCVSDLSQDDKYDPVVFDGLINQGFAKKVNDLSKIEGFDQNLISYCESLSATFNIDKINYIADSFYLAITGKVLQRPTSIPPVNKPKNQPSPPQNPDTDPASTIFDFRKFFSNFNIQTITAFVKNNKKTVGIVIGALIALILIINIISAVGKSVRNHRQATSTVPTTTEADIVTTGSNTTDAGSDVTTTTVLSTTNSKYVTEDSVLGSVVPDYPKEYYIKAENPGVYRFSATERTANYNVNVSVYDSNDNRVMSETNEGACTLDAAGEYKIVISAESSSCSYKLLINRPNPVKKITAENRTLHDAITFIGQCNVYTFTASVTGRYRVDCLNRTDGYNLDITVYNSNNERVFRETNGGYLDMQKGVVYSINVFYSTGNCEYDLEISIPNEVKDISTGETVFADELTFANQINTYTYTAPISGRYRFETNDRTNGYNVRIRMYDANDNRILNETNNGTVNLEKDVRYRIEIEYDTDLCSYDLTLGVPNEVKVVNIGESVSDSISFIDQENRYIITPAASGDYVVTARDRTNDYNVRISIFDANNNRVLHADNEGTVTFTAGTLYTIYVNYIDNLCDYTLSLG